MSAPTTPHLLVCFNHGKESGPWGTKITRLAEVARDLGATVISPDYSHTPAPDVRLRQLLATSLPAHDRLVLVGSSMGGYVAAQACAQLQPAALMLMAPALYFPGWAQEPEGIPADVEVMHGWHDDIVPLERVQRFAARHAAALHVFDADHGLSAALDAIAALFQRQLQRIMTR
jgi:pimeloyl-ACP methyl ester carboxylesterase